jgi:hypothetical protein
MQEAGPILQTVAAETMHLAMDVIVLGVALACGFLFLAFVTAVAAGVVVELRGGGSPRNVPSH